jgi:molybdenum cofactor cytidylyltransferase
MTESEVTMSLLFDPPPEQWGLRGDPFLWAAMQAHLAEVPIPAEKQTLEQLISDAFATLTGQAMTSEDDLFLEQFANGGMSSGYISPSFWRKQGMNTLINNWSNLPKTS